MSKDINVPLNWEEIDKIIVSLRLTNKAFKGEMRDSLVEKLCSYSIKAKHTDSKQEYGCKGDCIHLGRPTYLYPCNECVTNNFKNYTNKEE
jgi:hypothetical protein